MADADGQVADPFAGVLGGGDQPLRYQAAPPPADDENDPFAKLLNGQTVDPTGSSTSGAFTRGAARGALPAAGGLAGAGAGAAYGAAAGALVPGLGETGISELVGGVAGGLIGGFGGSFAAEKAQDYGLSKLPDSWVESIGQDERQQRLDQEQHPYATFLGGMAPFALTMKPGGFSAAAKLPENSTALQRLMVNPATQRLFSGALMGGMELGQEAAEGDVDWNKVAISTGFGLVFNKPNRFGEAIEGIIPRLLGRTTAHDVMGLKPQEPPFEEQGQRFRGRQDYDVGGIYGAVTEPPAGPEHTLADVDANYVYGERPPTLTDAWALGVGGPARTEKTFMGDEESPPAVEQAAQAAQREEQATVGTAELPNPAPLARDAHVEAFREYEALTAQRDALVKAADELPHDGALDAQVTAVEAKIADIAPEISAAHRRAAEKVGGAMVAPEGEAAAGGGDLQAIVDDAKRQFISAGRPPDEAEALGHIVASRMAARSEAFEGKIGTPEEIYRREGADIRGEDGKVRRVGGKRAKTGPEVVASVELPPELPVVPAEAEAEAQRRAASPEPDVDAIAKEQIAEAPEPEPEPEPVQTLESSEVGQPIREASSEETGGANMNSEGKQPPSSQPEPLIQDSQRAEPSESSTMRQMPPSIFEGPEITRFTDFSLGDIDQASGKKIIQGSSDYKALLAAAEENKPKLLDRLNELVKGVDGARVYGARAKDLPGLELKLSAKRRNPNTISDYLGARIVVDHVQNLDAILDKIKATGAIIEAEDFIRPGKEGYRAIHLQIGLGDGMSAELQLVPEPVMRVMDEAHEMRQPVKRLKESVDPADTAIYRDVMDRALKLFDDAWASAPEWSVDYGRDGETVRGGARELPESESPTPAPEPKPIRQTPSTTDLGGGVGGGDDEPRNVQEARRDEGLGPVGEGESVSGPPRSSDGTDQARPDPSTDAAAAGRVEARQKIAERSRANYRITDADAIGEGGPKAKIRANIDAIKTLKLIEDEAREATQEEKAKLVKYTGWGAFSEKMFNADRQDEFKAERKAFRALVTNEEYAAARASTKNAHYTSPEVVKGMWDALTALGYKGGEAIEPSAGIGHFIGLIPDSVAPRTSWTAVELDPLSARITKALYGGAEVNNQGFETLKRPSNYYDLAISNVPFGSYSLTEKPHGTHLIHDFFFVKSLDKVRPGGVVAFITSKGTMDKANSDVRARLAKDADLVGAIRLPGGKEGAFAGNAGTEATTDIIFLRKKIPGEAPFASADWMDTKEIQTPEGPTHINEYFADRPDMMLGEMRLKGSMYGANEPVLMGEPDDLRAKIGEAAGKMPPGAFTKRATPPPPTINRDDMGMDVKEGGYALKDGQIYRRVQGIGEPQKMSPETVARVSKLIGIRDIYNDLLKAQLGKGGDAEKLREALRDAYDEFVAKHGPIRKEVKIVSKKLDADGNPQVRIKHPNFEEFRDDPDVYKVASIENYDPEKDTATRAAIQTKDVIAAPVDRKINSSADALASVLDTQGKVDLQEIGKLMGAKDEDEVVARLGDLIYQNPNGREWESADQYLSGTVIKKLEDARAIAATDPTYARNVAALEKVQPPLLTAVDITAQLGAPWIPAQVHADFLKELGAVNPKVELLPVNKEWRVEADRFKPSAETKWGVGRSDVTLKSIMKAAFNNNQITVYDQIDRDTRVVNQAKTEEVAAKIEEIRSMFSGDPDKGVEPWAFADQQRGELLEGVYNRTMNDLVQWKADGSHLTLPGLNPMFTDRAHRKNAVWRILQKGNTLLAHAVGSGKTVTMIAAAMEQKRLGLIQKPCVAVPNHMLDQFSTEFIQAYPDANILVANKDEMSPDARRAFVAKTASNDWDAVIFTHSAFGRIGVSSETQGQFIQDQLAEYREALKAQQAADRAAGETKKSRTVKQLESAMEKMNARLQKLLNDEVKDEGTTFEESGIDQVIVDEAHLFKNLAFPTRYSNIRGLSSAASQRSEDLFMKIRYLEQRKPGRSAIFATGTPMSNSMAELWTMMRYLQLDKLKERGLDKFDAWGNTFGKVVTQPEMAPDGRSIKDVTSFSKFVNIPELISLYSEIADSQSAEQLNLPRPALMTRDGKPGIEVHTAQLSEHEEAAVRRIVERLAEIKGLRREKGEDNTLSLMGAGNKAALDGRLLRDGDIMGFAVPKPMEFNPNGKIALAVKNIKDIYDRYKDDPNARSQMVFMDRGTPKARVAESDEGYAATWDAVTGDERMDWARAAGSTKNIEDRDWQRSWGDLTKAEQKALRTVVPKDESAAGKPPPINLYEDMRQRLVAEGIPRKEIEFIHDADSDEKKRALFARMNDGVTRVLIGSTEKMGVGTNAQKRLIAMHHMDPTHKPAEIEQRDGRILRQGNLNKEVHILRYITERSLDATRWQLLERKAKFIGQVNSGSKGVRVAEDIDNPLPEAEMLKAAASGDPRIMQHAELTRQVRQLTAQKRGFDQTKQRATWQVKGLQSHIEELKRNLAPAKEDSERVQDIRGDKFKITLSDGTTLTDRKAAGEKVRDGVLRIAPQLSHSARALNFGEIGGFPASIELRRSYSYGGASQEENIITVGKLQLEGNSLYASPNEFIINSETDPVGLMAKFTGLLAEIKAQADRVEAQIAGNQKEYDTLSKAAAATWPRQAEYAEAAAKLAALTEDLKPKDPSKAPQAIEAEKPDEDERKLEQSQFGRILLRLGQRSIITLMKIANATTAIHELGHDFFEMLKRDAAHPEAPQRMRDMWEVAKRETGVGADNVISTKAHEKFANGYMRWLYEGTAPTRALDGVFKMFRDWMLPLYDRVEGLNVEISPALRSVFEYMHETKDRATVIAPHAEPGRGLDDLHAEAAEQTPHEHASGAADRVEAERPHFDDAQPPTEIADEIAQAVQEVEAAAAGPGGDAAGEVGRGDVGLPEMVGGGGQAGAQSGGGVMGGAGGQERAGGNAAPAEVGKPTAGGSASGRPESSDPLRDAPLAPRPVRLIGDGESPYVDKAGNFKRANINVADDVWAAIKARSEANGDFIGDRRAPTTWAQTQELAAAMGKFGAADLVDGWVRGRAMNAEQIVALKELLTDQANEVGRISRLKDESPEGVLAFATEQARLDMVLKSIMGATAEAGRALNIFRMMQGDIDKVMLAATGRTLYQKTQEMKLLAAYETPEAIAYLTDATAKHSFGRMLLEYWINGLISGPATHTTYVIGNMILSMQKGLLETTTAAALGALRGPMGRDTSNVVRFGEVAARLRGAASGYIPAVTAAADAFRTGLTGRLPGQDKVRALPYQPEQALPLAGKMLNEGATRADAKAAIFGAFRGVLDGALAIGKVLEATPAGERTAAPMYSPMGAIFDVRVRGGVIPIGQLARAPSRAIASIHTFFRAMNYSIEKSALIYRQAEGDAAKIAQLRLNTPDDIMSASTKGATDLTLMGPAGKFVEHLSKLTNWAPNLPGLGETPILKFIDPFVHIAANIIDQSIVQRTPAGLLSSEIRADLMGRNGVAAQDMAQARMIVGTALSIGFGSLAASGYVSGSGPMDRNKAAMWRMAGNQPHSVRIGDTWYAMNRLGPLGMLLGMSADLYDVAHTASTGDMLQAAALMQHAVTQNVLDESFMRGPAELIQAVEDPGRYGERYIQNFASSFVPYSVGMAQMARASDPYSRQARTVMDSIRAKTPGMSEELFPRLDIWGQPIPSRDALIAAGATAIYEQRMSQDPVNISLAQLGIGIAPVDRTIRNVQLTDQQYDDFARIAGRMAKQRLDVFVRSPDWRQWPVGVRVDAVKAIVEHSREAARGVLFMKYPQIMADATRQKMAKLGVGQ